MVKGVERELKPGEARCPGLSTKEIIEADVMAPPSDFIAEQFDFLGDEDLPFDAYYDEGIAQKEAEKLWDDCWQMVCREEEIPKARDFAAYDIAQRSYLVVRQRDGSVKAFINACKHRGMQLAESDSRGRAALIRCPFHGWSWDTAGNLKSIPCRWDFPHVDKEEFALDEVACTTWGGFVFIHPGDNPPPLTEYIAPLTDIDLPFPMEDRHIVYHARKLLPANWKVSLEAFLEAYHVLATHPEGLAYAGDANCQYDVLGNFTSRFIHTIGFQSPHLKGEPTEAQMLAGIGGEQAGLTLGEGERARDVWADHLRKTMGQQLGVDLAKVSTTQMMDSIEYFIFPNLVFFPGVTFPMVYRFRPDPERADQSIFDLYFLAPNRPGEDVPAAPEVVELGLDEPFLGAEGMDEALGFIYDQDVDNLGRQQKGIRASRKPGQTLGNYQEVRIRHMRNKVAEKLAQD